MIKIEVKRFNFDTDYERVKVFLTECYKENKASQLLSYILQKERFQEIRNREP